MDKYIHFFSCCIMVKGYERSAIYDIQRENIEFVPNTLLDFIEKIKERKLHDVLQEYKENKIAKEYLTFLEKKEFIFYSSKKKFPELPDISINEDTSTIIFATVILSKYIYDNIENFANNILNAGIKRLHIHIDNNNCMDQIKKIFLALEYSQVSNLSFSIPYQKIDKSVYKNERVTSLILYNSPKKRAQQNKEVIVNYITLDDSNLFLTRFRISDISIGIAAYNIAKNYNLSLYKTVFIDGDGSIKHNFYDLNSKGNIFDDFDQIKGNTIQELSKIWNINKDQISPCNVCEFRYCCTTTFIPKKNINGYTLDCNYDPFKAELTL